LNNASLIYHPQRIKTNVTSCTVYHDSFQGNEDPYLWNKQFLHSYCHITQLKNEVGQINFWISGDTYPNFTKLLCDCVFVVASKHYWKDANHMTLENPIVDNEQTFQHHYRWVNPTFNHHPFKRRRRYTLKADPDKSFQPQNRNRELIDILPFLNSCGLETQTLIHSITSKSGSRPFKLPEGLGFKLYYFLRENAVIKLYGKDIANLHP
tara:strand:+ start:2229 stop:2855 length:627 start_codon:yes stop_codon:yes gene_type:complete